jgi:hypothetical protein
MKGNSKTGVYNCLLGVYLDDYLFTYCLLMGIYKDIKIYLTARLFTRFRGGIKYRPETKKWLKGALMRFYSMVFSIHPAKAGYSKTIENCMFFLIMAK